MTEAPNITRAFVVIINKKNQVSYNKIIKETTISDRY